MKRYLTITMVLFITISLSFSGDVYKTSEKLAKEKKEMYDQLNTLSTKELIDIVMNINGKDPKSYASPIVEELPIICDILVERNAKEALPALINLSLQPAGVGEGQLPWPIMKASRAIVLLENNRFENKTDLQKAQTLLDIMSHNTTAEPNSSPLLFGLKNEMNVKQFGCISLMQEIAAKDTTEILPLLDNHLNSENPVMRSFIRNVYPRQRLIEKLHISIRTTKNDN